MIFISGNHKGQQASTGKTHTHTHMHKKAHTHTFTHKHTYIHRNIAYFILTTDNVKMIQIL